ncbi:hypothetical protein AAC387_Pa01g3019 [Persea americana]|eukprot:TRINITY_DN6912_c0_g1_i1.p3 TRINITY_DN6912_c0_g1~~TRINITY_DN6912_c0_g1_i1.p3  ORF type:complete len:150 (+),score=28.68 TRINITY_DN6912_c0_g1_i1:1208-1657(+)
MHHKTPSEIRLKRLGFSLASRCSICHAAEDSVGHLFFSCNLAISIWLWFLHAAGIQALLILSASTIWSSLSKENDLNGLQFMAALFTTVLFYLWRARNAAAFEDCRPSLLFIQENFSEAISFSLKQIPKPFVSPQICSLTASLCINLRP